MTERFSDMSDDALGRKLATELPRHRAPGELRAAIVETAPAPRRSMWFVPALTAAATALVLVLFFIPLLPRALPADPTQSLLRAVVAEHTRLVMWGARRPDIIPTGLPWLTQESGINLERFFSGDDNLRLISAEPVYLAERRGVGLYYRDDEGHLISYIVLPAPNLQVPERQRQQIERWRPALLQENGFAVWLWKHGDLACFLIADMVSETDAQHFKDYFVRVRVATEPVPAY